MLAALGLYLFVAHMYTHEHPFMEPGLFKDRNFRWLTSGAFLSMLGDQFTLIALPWLVLQMTGDTLVLGTVLALISVPRALFILIGGALVDRHSPKQVLMITKYVNLVLLAALAGLVFAGTLSLWMVYALSLGIGLEFRLIDNGIKAALEWLGMESALEGYGTSLGLFTSAWVRTSHGRCRLACSSCLRCSIASTLRTKKRAHLGATPWQGFAHVVLPLIAPSVVGIGMFGFTLSWDEIARTSQAIGDVNTLPLELQGLTSTVTTPSIYALGTVTTVVSFAVMGITLALVPRD